MKPENFDLLALLVKQRSGHVMSREKAYLLEARLLPVARKRMLNTLDDLAQLVRVNRDEGLMGEIVEAMTINESLFFRDQKPFTHFQKVLLPQMLATRSSRKQIRIWSAASSSGQEAYSLAMLCAEEAAKLQGWKVDIVGTDLSKEMVERAKGGFYSQFEVQRGLPVTMLVKYFQQLAGDKWQIKENIRQMVKFREGNLMGDLTGNGIFDIVFCRNVLIYFDPPTKARVLKSIASVMAADGALVLGGAETVLGITNEFKPGTEHGFYILSPQQNATARKAVI